VNKKYLIFKNSCFIVLAMKTNKNPLKNFLDTRRLNLYEFSKFNKIPHSNLWRIYHRKTLNPKLDLLLQIEKATGRHVTVLDFINWITNGR
jgi:predicted transcriptional regulator